MDADVAPEIAAAFPRLNAGQLSAIARIDHPLLIIAGPGAGKTLVLVFRALNILLQGNAKPNEIALCTFTEKAAFELRDRILLNARKLGYQGDLSQLKVGTIHGLCNSYINRYLHHTWLGNNYEVLDELTQALFLFDHFEEIVGEVEEGHRYLNKWSTKWTAIDGIKEFFNKITEELVDPQQLVRSADPFLRELGRAYLAYEQQLKDYNRIDFAHLQKLFLELLENDDIQQRIQGEIRYLMVDEYQDTNYVQEQVLLKLIEPYDNVCVVGDEDQSLYRFRGATVRNILEFPGHFDGFDEAKNQVGLTVNYRSHENIVKAYNRFMSSVDWTNPGSQFNFRFEKEIVHNPDEDHLDYPAVFAIWGESEKDEAARVADLVNFLKQNDVIQDYNQVALLLHSVRLEHSRSYIEALQNGKGIPVFAPRARGYFETAEVQHMVACWAVLFKWYGNERGQLQGYALSELGQYVDQCLGKLASSGVVHNHPLAMYLQQRVAEIEALQEGETLNQRLGDYFYRMIAYEPFASMMQNDNRARNLASFSQLLSIFQNYYHYSVVTHSNRYRIRFHFFNSFLRFLQIGGINEYDDPEQPFPSGYVQLMTIHQSKGLEFPVVIVGSLAKNLSSPKQVDRLLGPYYHRATFEPENRITLFDRMRLHYVAFSRAEKVLALATTEQPKEHFNSIWQGLPQWPYVQQELLAAQRFELKERMKPVKSFSFTNHIKVYETCPRQYLFFREYEFMPARSAEIFFGSLVHQTIEDIHRWVLDGQASKLVKMAIPGFFENNFRNLVNAGLRPIDEQQRDTAYRQVMNYFDQNQDMIGRIVETEVDVSVEKEGRYILTGRVDLLVGVDDKLELLDFKSQPKPDPGDPRAERYYQQLLMYAHILEQRYGKQPDRLALYWTGENNRQNALMTFPYDPAKVNAAAQHFESVVTQIMSGDFRVKSPPAQRVCLECDFRTYCRRLGTIQIG